MEKLVIEDHGSTIDLAAMQDRVSPRQPMDIDFQSNVASDSESSHQGASSGHTWNQFRALMNKNLALQGKQKGTNICQVYLL